MIHITVLQSFGTISTSIRGIVHLPLYLIKTNCAYAAGVIFSGRYKLSTLLTEAVRGMETQKHSSFTTHTRKTTEKKPPSVLTTMRWGGDNGLAESVCASVRETFPSSDGWESYSSDPHTICLCKEKQNRVKRTACHTRRRTKVHNFIHQNQAEKRKELKKEAEYYRLEFKSVAMIQKCISHTECTCLADLYM